LRRWRALLALCAACSLPLPALGQDDLVGRSAYALIHPEQSAVEVAFAAGVGCLDILLANPELERRARFLPEILLLPGQHLLPKGMRQGVVINLAQLRLFVFSPEGALQVDVPIVPGKTLTRLPLGSAHIASVGEEERPSIELHTGTIDWNIHGSGQARADVELAPALGLRLLDRDMAQLARFVTPETTVHVIDQRVAAGWHEGEIWLQVHPRVEDQVLVASGLRGRPPTRGELTSVVLAQAGDLAGRVDWAAVDAIGAASNGVPVRITRLGASEPETP
jgi:hypothetical protein